MERTIEQLRGTIADKQWLVASTALGDQGVSTSVEILSASGRIVERAGFRGPALAPSGQPNCWVGHFDELPTMVVARVPASAQAAEIEGTMHVVPAMISEPMPGAEFRVVAAFLEPGNAFVAVRTTG